VQCHTRLYIGADTTADTEERSKQTRLDVFDRICRGTEGYYGVIGQMDEEGTINSEDWGLEIYKIL